MSSTPVSRASFPAQRRLWASTFLVLYIGFIAVPIWYHEARVPRTPLPYDDISRLETAVASPLAAALPVTITVYLVCPGSRYQCLEQRELSAFAQQLWSAVVAEAGLPADEAPLTLRVLHDAPGSCTATTWEAPGVSSYRRVIQQQWAEWGWQGHGAPFGGGSGGSGCLDLVSSSELHRTVLGGGDREFDDWAAKEVAGQNRPGNYHLFIVPDPWMALTAPPYGSVGRRRVAFVRYPRSFKPTHGSVVQLAAMVAAPAFASSLGPGRDADQAADAPRLPISPAAQLHLSFSLCNAHPSPHRTDGGPTSDNGAAAESGGGPGSPAAAAAFSWDFAQFEAQYVAPVKHVLAPAARLTVSSQVLYFTPGRVHANWSAAHAAYVLPFHQLPFFVDSAWPLDPGRNGPPAAAATGGGGSDAEPYDVATVDAGSRAIAIGEVLSLALPQEGTAGRAAGEAAAAEQWPRLLPPPAAESLPPAVLHFVLYAPQPWQRPLSLLGPGGQRAAANSFWVPGWGMLQVLNQVPPEGLLVAEVQQQAMEEFAVEFVTQLRSLLGLGAARRRILRLGADPTATSSSASGSATAIAATATAGKGGAPLPGPFGNVTLLTALRTGLAPWEVDALVRRRSREDVVAAAATLASLTRLLAQVPTLAVPPHVGALVRDAAAALRRALRYAMEGRYEETSRAAQEARSWAEAAFSDPALSSRLNVPETHMVGVYLPFCLPAAVPLLQALIHEIRRRRRRSGAGADKAGPRPAGRHTKAPRDEGEPSSGGEDGRGGGGRDRELPGRCGGDADKPRDGD